MEPAVLPGGSGGLRIVQVAMADCVRVLHMHKQFARLTIRHFLPVLIDQLQLNARPRCTAGAPGSRIGSSPRWNRQFGHVELCVDFYAKAIGKGERIIAEGRNHRAFHRVVFIVFAGWLSHQILHHRAQQAH